ncbi:MauE/DoxX family redox-associated membrane protein [Pedobacter helvus]|uniref:MauE/DoxX family redox-associated membrane protein n=1 Tax=Pedobacter helvus TaxID=2563444 RepID=A0ABW9JHT2_9SPHI|nr:MauE/DoxX family redox-associated membrane protein [Pedobacter ureilyticus]
MVLFDVGRLDCKAQRRLQWIAAAFVLLLAYAALSKLTNYGVARRAMLVQVFSREMALTLVWLVPVVELLVVLLLLFVRTRLLGLWLATLLMLSFSVYLIIAYLGGFGKVPCGCGGILGKMGYSVHLVFNLCFVALGVWGIVIAIKGNLIDKSVHLGERRSEK